ncbi:helix-turn-helix transcriptional regulator [Microscilla marina]|uniref:WYL domain-containing protein n=1 Tax=Microscilla marina ATCC 23134 TaxID=313606 RepID=A1ZHY8_MICM2|nr:WYL domain-containing protein [Microscilla marina]EAY30145.1 hypothetical protein M23134_05478 [Microscilla marina ATCC 23134]
MTSQETNLKTFRLIRLLSSKPYRTYEELANELGATTRTIRRYFETLISYGYIIEKDYHQRHHISNTVYPAQKGVSFTQEETELLWYLLKANADQHTLQGDILKKLFIPVEFHPIADQDLKTNNARNVEQLAKAIRDKKRALVGAYYSAHSDTTTDRLVEPLGFSENYQAVSAYELKSDQIKNFKVDRIKGEVQVLNVAQTNQEPRQASDWFGFIGDQPIKVHLKLSKYAATLLAEDFPRTKPYITTDTPESKRHDARYPLDFQAEVRNLAGFGRFVLGIPGETKVISPISFKDYLNDRIKKVKF